MELTIGAVRREAEAMAGIVEARERWLIPAYPQHFGDKPLVVASASGAYVYDLDGRRYIDAFGGVATISVGHCDREVLEAEIAQMRRTQHVTTLYLHESPARAAEALALTMPDMGEVQCYFTNSGTEATEFAVRLARFHTARSAILAIRNSFHGCTLMSASLTAQQQWRDAGPYAVDVHHVPGPYAYREKPPEMKVEDYEAHTLAELERTIWHTCGGKIAALIVEPIQGNGGVLHGSDAFYGGLVDIVHRADGLVIADEVQTGFQRTGRWWGSSWWPQAPDIRTMAKGMGNGYPVGGVAARKEIAAAFKGRAHSSTFGASPPAMAGVAKVIEIVGRDEMRENIARRGCQFANGLLMLARHHPAIGDIRGKGLMIGIELVRDRSKTPAIAETERVMDLCRDNGVLIGRGGAGNVLRITPPFCLSEKDVEKILRVLDGSITEIERTIFTQRARGN